jgi:hypothetical protein
MKPIDIFPLYHGCFVARFDQDGKRLSDCKLEAWIISKMEMGDRFIKHILILRPISDISHTEVVAAGLRSVLPQNNYTAEQVFKLIKMRFDLFELKEKGLAIHERLNVIENDNRVTA